MSSKNRERGNMKQMLYRQEDMRVKLNMGESPLRKVCRPNLGNFDRRLSSGGPGRFSNTNHRQFFLSCILVAEEIFDYEWTRITAPSCTSWCISLTYKSFCSWSSYKETVLDPFRKRLVRHGPCPSNMLLGNWDRGKPPGFAKIA